MIHFVTTRPRGDRCPRCGRLRLTGLTEGVPFRVDAAPITLLAELSARITGRMSYWLCGNSLASRGPEKINADRIRGRPLVFVTHRCATPVAAEDIDATYLPAFGRILPKLLGSGDWTDTELDAFERLAATLGARVIDTDAPPF